MFFKQPLQTIGYVTKSPSSSYYRFTLKNKRRSINNSHIFYHDLILKSYPKHHQLTLLFDFVTIIIDKVDLGMISRITIDFISRLINGYAWSVCYNFGKS